jgi:hypothetical protein
MLIRLLSIALFFPINSWIGLKQNWQEALFMVVGGLRGAVGIALGNHSNTQRRLANYNDLLFQVKNF